MKLQFEANQDYQLEAITAVVDVFAGQPLEADGTTELIENDGEQLSLENTSARGNHLLLDKAQLLANTAVVQARNGLSASTSEGYDFTIEMETGTGKTYVYLRTIHELHSTYGFKKFIIVVPSIAIKEGVLKNLEITREHFAGLYNNPEMDYYVWDSKKRGQARQFATNDTLQIMVITIDSFTKAENIMNQVGDYGRPADYIRATNPVIIIDEPQNMETDARRSAIQSLNPLCTLRYSATHKNYYNLLYKLDPVKAYDLGLVKKIEVDSILSEDAFNSAYINLLKIERRGKSAAVAHIEIDSDDARGLQRKVLKLSGGEDLQQLTGRDVYEGYILDYIYPDDEYIEFANGKTFQVGQKDEALHEQILQRQIERTVENHFEKELKLADEGIKVLSLFFIDKVSNYRSSEGGQKASGKFALWFEESYRKIRSKPKFSNLPEYDPTSVHNGYFSVDKTGAPKDTRGDSAADDNTYHLIMKDKERLLDPNEPLRFIFSHSALREGWDNPNVFNICTLNETSSELKKRQEIGRGLRLPVDAAGKRVRNENTNILTVVANESYDEFSRKLQTEIEEETGVSFSGRVKNKQDRKRVVLRKNAELDDSFTALWDKIKHQTSYQVHYDTDELIRESVEQLSEVMITKPRIINVRTRIQSMEGGFETTQSGNSAITVDTAASSTPDVLGKIQAQTKLTRQTIFAVLDQAGLLDKILINPQQVVDEVSEVIRSVMRQLLIEGVEYRKTGSSWDIRQFENGEFERYLDNLTIVTKPEKTLYDYVPVDSNVERNFVGELERNDDVRFYVKLPSWFTINTPVGNYNPDWAIVFVGDKRVYFAAETKGTNDINDLHLGEGEKLRIKAGRKHFQALGVPFIGPVDTLSAAIHALPELTQ